MSEYTISGDISNLDDYDVTIDVTYYDQDYDYSVFEEPIDNEITTTPTDILFE